MQKFTKYITHVQGVWVWLKEKMFLHVLAANPPNLMKKEQKKKKLQPFIDNHQIICKIRKKK